jgi:hypothetical protein
LSELRAVASVKNARLDEIGTLAFRNLKLTGGFRRGPGMVLVTLPCGGLNRSPSAEDAISVPVARSSIEASGDFDRPGGMAALLCSTMKLCSSPENYGTK